MISPAAQSCRESHVPLGSGEPSVPDAQTPAESQSMSGSGTASSPAAHGVIDSQRIDGSGEPSVPEAQIARGSQGTPGSGAASSPAVHKSRESRSRSGSGEPSEDQPNPLPEANTPAAGLQLLIVPDLAGFQELRVWAESFADAQDHRKRLMNRLGLKVDGTPQTTGARVPPEQFEALLAPMKEQERVIALAMRRSYRRIAPPGVIAWQKSMFGIGEHLLARLLGTLGHPRIATPFHWEGEGADRKLIPDLIFERSLRQLWAYCGYGDPERKKRKGMSAEEAFGLGSPRAKMLVHLLAEATMKCRVAPSEVTPALNASAHPAPSPDQSNGPSMASLIPAGRDPSDPEPTLVSKAIDDPAGASSADQPTSGSKANGLAADRRYRATYDEGRLRYTERDWTLGHQHAAALRLVAKHILRDLWQAAS